MVAKVTLEMVFDAMTPLPRQIILAAIAKGPICVNDIAKLVKLPQPTVSYHLRTLKSSSLVTDIRDGKNKFYSLSPQVVKQGDRLAVHGLMWIKLAALGTADEGG